MLRFGCLKVRSSFRFQTSQASLIEKTNKMLENTSLPLLDQPHPKTQPWLFGDADNSNPQIFPTITAKEFKSRRRNLMATLFFSDKTDKDQEIKVKIPSAALQDPELPQKYVAIITANNLSFQSHDIPDKFKQSSNFSYLTGFLEPDSVLVLETVFGHDVKSTIFVKRQDYNMVINQGFKNDIFHCQEHFGIDQAYFLDDLEPFLRKNYVLPQDSKENRKISIFLSSSTPATFKTATNFIQPFVSEIANISKMRKEKVSSVSVKSINSHMDEIRLIKSENELGLLKSSCKITAGAINLVAGQIENVDNESEVANALNFSSRNLAGPGNAISDSFLCNVSAGDRTTITCYVNNNMPINNKHVLINYGISLFGYSSSISRVFNIKTETEKKLYTSIYNIQENLIKFVKMSFDKKSGAREKITLNEINNLGQLLIIKELVKFGFTKDAKVLSKIVPILCPHSICYYIGLDKHDTPTISSDKNLMPGMTFNIRVGLYFPHTMANIPEEFKGLGMRLEDSIIINEDKSVEVISEGCKKAPEDVFK